MPEVLIVIAGIGVVMLGVYGGMTAITLFRKRFERREGPLLPAEELEALHARLAATEALESRVAELEERLDFAERILARQEPGALPSGTPSERV